MELARKATYIPNQFGMRIFVENAVNEPATVNFKVGVPPHGMAGDSSRDAIQTEDERIFLFYNFQPFEKVEFMRDISTAVQYTISNPSAEKGQTFPLHRHVNMIVIHKGVDGAFYPINYFMRRKYN